MIVCELPIASRILYGTLGPLISGGCLFSAVVAFGFAPLRDKDVPPWMETFAFHAAVGLFMLGFAVFLASQISAINAWIRLEGKELRVRRFWSGRVIVRALSDVVTVGPDGIRFKDGTQEALEGRAGPGLPVLLSAIPGCMTDTRPSKGA